VEPGDEKIISSSNEIPDLHSAFQRQRKSQLASEGSLETSPLSWPAWQQSVVCPCFSLRVVLPFVEQEATHAKLRAIGVDFAQGYYFGMPGPAPS
jgi:FOG: EAL domain